MASVKRPPGPRPLNPFKNITAFGKDFCGYMHQLRLEYGDVVYFRVGGRRMYLVSDPELARQVLVVQHRNFTKSRGLELVGKVLLGQGLLTSEGEVHRRQRKMMQPAFHGQAITGYGQVMVDYTTEMCAGWQAGEVYDMADEMMHVTMNVVGKCLFDADVRTEAVEIGRALDDAMKLFAHLANPLAPLMLKLPLPQTRTMMSARGRIDKTINRIIEERMADPESHADLLQMLLDAVDEEDGTKMSMQQVRDEVVTLFLAGHETTANALTWTLYLLSQHPEVRARFHAEVDSALGGRTPTAADMRALPYTRQVFAESMRLYPPAHSFGRKNIEAFELGGFTIPAKSTLIFCPYAMHRHERYWPDPERFDPERWAGGMESSDRPKHCYLPFGGGPRTCIGEPFAWMEGVLILSAIAQRWQLDLEPGHVVETLPQITLRPRFGMRMVVTPRETSAGAGHAHAAGQ